MIEYQSQKKLVKRHYSAATLYSTRVIVQQDREPSKSLNTKSTVCPLYGCKRRTPPARADKSQTLELRGSKSCSSKTIRVNATSSLIIAPKTQSISSKVRIGQTPRETSPTQVSTIRYHLNTNRPCSTL